MKTNPFNICPNCIHRDTCVLTDQKSQVWSCSEYEETTAEVSQILKTTSNIKIEGQSEMAMV